MENKNARKSKCMPIQLRIKIRLHVVVHIIAHIYTVYRTTTSKNFFALCHAILSLINLREKKRKKKKIKLLANKENLIAFYRVHVDLS